MVVRATVALKLPELPESLGMPVALAVGASLVVWYLAGNELMRRRVHRLAVWSQRVLEPLGAKQSIQWLGAQAFRLEVAEPRPPFSSLTITGLVESWDVPFLWFWNRLHGRRDLVVLHATLRTQPIAGFEVYRPGTILAGDSRHFAREEGWSESRLQDLVVAAPTDGARDLAAALVNIVDRQRPQLIRLGVRRQKDHLTLALNVPDTARFDAETARQLAQRLANQLI